MVVIVNGIDERAGLDGNKPWKMKLKKVNVIKLMTDHDCGVDLFCLDSQIHGNLLIEFGLKITLNRMSRRTTI